MSATFWFMQMKSKTVALGCIALSILFAVALGLRGVARAVGMFQPPHTIQSPDIEERPIKHPRVTTVSHSPDAYRDELLK